MTIFSAKESEQVQFIYPAELTLWLSQNEKPILIDVRNREDHLQSNLGGINIPITEFASAINHLDPDEPVVVYCQVGQKSFNAASLLVQADFSCVYSLQGGIAAWHRK
ncbi:MAG: rhodanese-like domain-containing protein [Kangiellaceae bacterium]|nr:rhodanese-like domain-containing protein [Kangiellaceae bacterium]